MPQYLYGSGYDAIAQQQLARDQMARQDARFALEQAQQIRNQLENERYRQAQFEVAQQDRQAALAQRQQALNQDAALGLARLRYENQNRQAIRDQARQQMELTREAIGNKQSLGEERLQQLEHNQQYKEANPRIFGGPTFANRLALEKMAQQDEELAGGANSFASFLNQQMELDKQISALGSSKEDGAKKSALNQQKNAITTMIGALSASPAARFVDLGPDGKFQSRFKPRSVSDILKAMPDATGTGGGESGPVPPNVPTAPQSGGYNDLAPLPPGASTAPPAAASSPPLPPKRPLPPGVTREMLLRDAQRKIQEEGYDPFEIRKGLYETYGIY